MTQIEALRTWLVEESQAPCDRISTIHFDELGISHGRELGLPELERVFRDGITLAASLGDYFKFMVVVPVKRSRRLMSSRNLSLNFLLARLLWFEPPSIYLLRPPQYLGRAPMEEYRFPLPAPFESVPSDAYEVYFRQFRSNRYIEMGAEYENGVYFEQFRRIESPDGGRGRIAV